MPKGLSVAGRKENLWAAPGKDCGLCGLQTWREFLGMIKKDGA
jgi:hypothetical protein